MSTMTWTYAAYLIVCTGITIWVARSLRKHGRVFLATGDDGTTEFSDALSHLLIVGFYLVNLGVICFALKLEREARDAQTAIELLSTKVGMILVVIGVMHFLILAVLARVRMSAEEESFDDFSTDAIHEVASARRRANH